LIESRQVAGGKPQWRGRTRTNKLVFFPATRPTARREQARTPSTHDGATVLVATETPEEPRDSPTEIRPGDLVNVRIERATAWSLQGVAVSR
jgi:tRNA-2-methylthio-N6-dimethylallyladenosine synthase